MKLFVSHYGVDYTLKMDSFTNESKNIEFDIGDVYIGYYKPIRNVYVEMVSRAFEDVLSLQYWNGSEYVDLPDLEDKTFGLVESGLISWGEAVQVKTTVEGREAYWLKLNTTTPAEIEINGINLVLSNDKDLSFVPNLKDHLAPTSSSFIAFHEEARNMIIQYLRNSGKKINGYEDIFLKQVDQFDLLDINELKQASKYLALHLIFDDLSKSNDDQYFAKAERFWSSYESSLNDRLLSIDVNNNGIKDDIENLTPQFIRLKRE